MAEAFFNKIADDVLTMTDQIQSLMTTGSLPSSSSTSSRSSSYNDGSQQQQQQQQPNIDLDELMESIDVESLSEDELNELLEEHGHYGYGNDGGTIEGNMMDSSPLKGIADSVIGDIVGGQVGPQTPYEHFDAFRSAIRWKEPFIIGMIIFQIVIFMLCLYVSRKDRGLLPRLSALVFVGIIVRSAEWINSVAAEHWESFATQDYFDKRGIFISIFLSGPLLLDSLMMLMMYVAEAGQLLVEVKKRELKSKKKPKSKDDSSSNNSKKKKAA